MKVTDITKENDFLSLLCDAHGGVTGYNALNNIITFTFKDGYIFNMDVPNYEVITQNNSIN